jgi:drug/metabolite transporter (DMT)-like permease
MKANGRLAWPLLIGLGFTWGSSFILMKKGLIVFSPIQIACLRIFISSLVLMPFVVINFHKIPLRRWWMFLIAGLLGNGIPAFMFPLAQTRLDSSLVGMLNSMMPLLTLLVGALFFKTKINRRKMVGIALGMGGVTLLLWPKMGNSADFSFAGFVLIASLCYAINTNFVRRYLSDIDSVSLTAFAFFFIGPLAGIQLFQTDFMLRMTNPGANFALGLISILAILGTALAVVVFNFLVKVKSALFAASVTYIVPVFAILWGLIFNESLASVQFAGMAVVLLGVYVVNT